MSSAVTVSLGDCVEVLKARAADAPLFDACATDAPYHLSSIVKRFGAEGAAPARKGRGAKATGAYSRASAGFMGKTWDGGDVAFRPETWRAIFDALKPGAHLVAFGGTRNHHRMFCAIEDAGFEIRDTIFWLYGSGFPKSHDAAKGIDQHLGVKGETVAAGAPVRRIRPGADQHKDGSWEKLTDREFQPGEYLPASEEAAEWDGWGTALKPSVEPICLARKPLSEKSVAANLLKWGTGALNIDACRVDASNRPLRIPGQKSGFADVGVSAGSTAAGETDLGRWPANIIHDGSEEVLAAFPAEANGGHHPAARGRGGIGNDGHGGQDGLAERFSDTGSAARFFYSSKAGPLDRLGSAHPTVKPVDLMRWLCRLVCPPSGLILDPFAGSGTTGIAALAEGMRAELIDIEPDHVADIERKLAIVAGEGRHRLVEMNERKKPSAGLPLFPTGQAA